MNESVDISVLFPYVMISHKGSQYGLSWSHAEAVYIAGKRMVADAQKYDETSEWTETIPEPEIAGIEFRRMGLMIHMLLNGRAWIEAPYQVMRKILKVLYQKSKELEAECPSVALRQITDQAVLYASAAPLGLTADRRKIDEALKLTINGIPPLGIVPPPTLTGGTNE